MISRQEARQIVADWLIAHPARGPEGPLELCILDEHTIEADFGWVFFWQSERFVATGNFSDSLAGNGPLIVDRGDGTVHLTGTAHPVEHYIEKYRRERAV